MGSLYAAAASYLDALAHGGRWLVRMEDLDTAREVPGAADRILRTLEAYGFAWHGEVVRQSTRTRLYAEALEALGAQRLTFACRCSRSQLEDGGRYPGTCRALALPAGEAALRLRTAGGELCFNDRVQGSFCQDVNAVIGDPVIRRRDGIIAYLLAVVVDDEAQRVSHVVRGADLLDNTPRQIYLQRLLSYTKLSYAHVPLLTEAGGAKLAKSKHSVAAAHGPLLERLVSVFALLGMRVHAGEFAHMEDAWRWARGAWSLENVPKRLELSITS